MNEHLSSGGWSQLAARVPADESTAKHDENRCESAAQIERFIEELAGDTPSREAREWNRAGWSRYQDGRGVESLECCFGLAGEPSGTWRTWLAEGRKRSALLDAWQAVTRDDVSAWRRSGLLAEAIRAFEQREWPALKALPELPAGSSALRSALFSLFSAGARQIPRAQRRINDIVTEAMGIHCNERR